MDKKETILKLRAEGKTYREIVKLTGFCKSTIAFHASENVRKTTIARNTRNRFAFRRRIKEEAGGKCIKCGYNRCFEALEFHHCSELGKDFNITDAIHGKNHVSRTEILEEVKKCILVCANCHREIHAGILN